MFVVIFKAKIRQLDDEYSKIAERMRQLAISEFGCLEFSAITEGSQEIALSYWPDEKKIRNWKKASEHLIAQEIGKEKWYGCYEVQICEIKRQYHFPI